ncbi:hypothetical protein F5Y18DRAFT_440475 [Xylariaceae sp. FL1019]|nr:hypothetical protein F5Y18DRAFT_440475 [Xylariaceae sp. FL1019]
MAATGQSVAAARSAAPKFQSSEIPLQSKERMEMLDSLENNASYYELSLIISSQARHLKPYERTHKTTRAKTWLEDDRRFNRQLFIMLHTIPRELLEAIILGTVADYFLKQRSPSASRHPFSYEGDGPGTYVGALSINGRNGHFTTPAENDKLVAGLKKYADAYRRQLYHNGSPRNRFDKELDKFARDVDSAYGSRPATEPTVLRFIQNEDGLKNVERLISSFERRRDATANLPNMRDVPARQSPLMVGCSNHLDGRMCNHNPHNPGSLTSTTRLWALTICLIKLVLNEEPVTTVRPVIRTWHNDHLGPSEALVTALASSYVWQDGFNVIGAGFQNGTKLISDLLRHEEYVLVKQPYFERNIAATRTEMAQRKEYIDTVSKVVEFPSLATKQALADARTALADIQAKTKQRTELIAKLQKRDAELKVRHETMLREKDRLQRMVELIQRINGTGHTSELIERRE